MVKSTFYTRLKDDKTAGRKNLAVLLDPDKLSAEHIRYFGSLDSDSLPDVFLVGGSLIQSGSTDKAILSLKKAVQIPVLIFPGNAIHISTSADGILFLSLVSGRNPEFLIGQHVVSASALAQSSLEVISTGYLLIDGGRPTSVSYMSGTQPIPRDKTDIIVSTAMASKLIGHHQIYLDAGSGAQIPVPEKVIKKLNQKINLPLWVGGGIRSAEQVYNSAHAGADVIVVGNRLEQNPELLPQMAEALQASQKVRP